MANRHEMESQISQLKRDLEQAELEGQTLRAKLEVYTGKEQAMAQALTEATASASRIRASAQEEIERLRAESRALMENAQKEADQLRKKAFADADGIVADANKKAAAIIADAQEDAKLRIDRANAAVAKSEARVQRLNNLLTELAQQSREQAISMDIPAQPAAAQSKPAGSKLPEEYASPKELMHGIYQLQGRETPAAEAPAAAPKAAVEEPAITPIPFHPPAYAAPAEGAAADPAPQAAAADDAMEEPRVWTVDEIMAQADNTSAPSDTSSELNDLLDEILKD